MNPKLYYNTIANIKAIVLLGADPILLPNATTIIETDTYSLINCIDGLFTPEAEQKINDEYINSIKTE
jgi:hypothetical protein